MSVETQEDGSIFVSIKEVKGLLINERTDVYCVITVEKQITRTSTCFQAGKGCALEWNEGYTFDLTTTNGYIAIVVWGKSNNFPSGKILGQTSVSCSTLRRQKKMENSTKLYDIDYKETSAELSYKIHYAASNHTVCFDDFIMLRFIGNGAFGRVMLVRKKDTGRLFAMKVMRKDKVLRESAIAFPWAERQFLKKYNHPNVVHLKYAFQTNTHLYMVMDYINGGELFYYLRKKGTLEEDTAKFFAAQIVLAIGFLHEHNVIYRDLKPENCLIDMNGNLCLVDFGLCKEGVLDGQKTYSFCGTLKYMAPEALKGKGYGKTVDWWALGTVLYEMLTGCHPFVQPLSHSQPRSHSHSNSASHSQTLSLSQGLCGDLDDAEISSKIINDPVRFPPHLPKDAVSLLTALLQKDPNKRLGNGVNGTEAIKKHPFFAQIDWKKLAKKEIDPPFKPHVREPEEMSEPWACVSDSPTFEILNDSDQDYFRSFSYVFPSELSRSFSSPAHSPFRYLHTPRSPAYPYMNANSISPQVNFLNHSYSPKNGFFCSQSPNSPNSPKISRMVKSPGFNSLASYLDLEGADEPETENTENSPQSVNPKRWSGGSFSVSKIEYTGDVMSGHHSDPEDQPSKIKVKSKSFPFLKGIKKMFKKNKKN